MVDPVMAKQFTQAAPQIVQFDVVGVPGSGEGRMIESVDHLHEHFATPSVVRDGRPLVPRTPDACSQLPADSVAENTGTVR